MAHTHRGYLVSEVGAAVVADMIAVSEMKKSGDEEVGFPRDQPYRFQASLDYSGSVAACQAQATANTTAAGKSGDLTT